MDWAKILQVYGPFVLIVFAAGWFYAKRWYPDDQDRQKRSEQRQDKSQEAFLAALAHGHEVQSKQTDIIQEQVTISHQIVERLKELQQNARGNARSKRN